MKFISSLLAAAALSVAAFVAPAIAQDKGTVGISMPTKISPRWISDGDTMVKLLKEAGYTTDLQFAEDDIPNQLAQIENMVTKGVKVLSSPPSTARRCRTFCSRPPTPASRSSPMTA